MKVLHILNELNPSGAEVMLRDSYQKWLGKGIDSHILSTGVSEGSYSESLAQAGYQIHHIPFKNISSFSYDFYKFLKINNFDVIHIHTEKLQFLTGIISKMLKTKSIIKTSHSNFSHVGLSRVIKLIQRRILSFFDVKYVSISSSVEYNEMHRYKNKSYLINNWYDNFKFVPVSDIEKRKLRNILGLPEDKLIVITVGNCSEVKNHKAIFEALGQLKSELNFHFLHIGKENESMSERDIAQNLEIYSYCSFLGFIDDVSPYLQASDIFVMPSKYEGFGVAAVEALGVGLLTVLSKVPGLSDFKGVIDTIFWIEPNANEIVKILRQINKLSDTDKKQLSRLSHQQAQKKFGLQSGVDQYYQLYLS